MKYTRIISYGCSFTAGQELADALVLGIPEDELDEMKKTIPGNRADELLYKGKRVECDKLGHSMAWPNHVGKRFNLPVLNQARYGTSLLWSIFSIERDYLSGLIQESDLVLLGVTSPGRVSWIAGNGIFINQIFGYKETWFDHELHDALVKHWATDENIIWDYFHKMRYADLLSKSRNNQIVMTMPVCPISHTIGQFPHYKKTHPWLDNMQFDNLVLPEYSVPNSEDNRHGWRHPKLDSHIKYAEVLSEELIRLGILDENVS